MLEIKNISIQAGEKDTVKNVSLSIRPREVHVLMGANGSGKSSLANGLMGHPKYKIFDGEIFLDDEDITFLATDKKAKRGLFLSLQQVPEIDGVSFTNFLYRAHKEMKGSEMTIFEFHKYLSEKVAAYGLSSDFLKRNVNAGFSGGEKKQSEAFQLAFFEPKFAFLDEMDSGVDIDALDTIFRTITKLREKGTGFLLITHYGKILEKITPDYVHIMKGGAITHSGGPELAAEIAERGFKDF